MNVVLNRDLIGRILQRTFSFYSFLISIYDDCKFDFSIGHKLIKICGQLLSDTELEYSNLLSAR